MLPVSYPPWVVLHVPHDSLDVPPAVRGQFVLDDAELLEELVRMTDHLTADLFAGQSETRVVRAPVSRLVVDAERFPDDAAEPMAKRGMGAVYTVTSQLIPLRRALQPAEREALLRTYYWPHHARLEAAVTSVVEQHGRCLVLDCHSFPSVALPYERAEPLAVRPDICIGTDPFHTPHGLAQTFVHAFRHAGWTVQLNQPFSGALVPASYYRADSRVQAVMVEVNRKLYLQESNAAPLEDFKQTTARVQRCCIEALHQL